MSTTYHSLSSSNFVQDWSDAGLISTTDTWDAVPSVVGYRGDALAPTTGLDPQTVVSDGTAVVDVNVNQANPATNTSGGVTEFALADPVVALQGSGTGQAPNLVVYLDATGRQDITVSYRLRDLDGSIDNAIQSVALQYRIGATGDFVNVPAAFVADASSGPSLATLETLVAATLPAEVNGASQLQIRIITTNAVGNDEWIGIDDISVTSQEAVVAPPSSPSLAFAGQLNETQSFDGTVSGKIVITLSGGETFTGSDGDALLATGKATLGNVPAGLTAVLTRISATTAELRFTGSATSHTTDIGNLTLTFDNTAFAGGNAAAVTGSSKNDLALNFGSEGLAGSTQTFTPNAGTATDSSDASTAIALDANWMVVGDDEASVLRVYAREGGAAVVEWSYAAALGNGGELDLEAGTRIGDTLYLTGSFSNSKGGGEADSREFIFAVTVSGSGAGTQFTYQGKHTGLEAALALWDSSNAHGKGANYFGLAASSSAGVVPEGVNGFSIEGMTASQDGTQLLLAFRAPQTDAGTREKALIVPVAIAGLIGGSSPTFGAPIELDLGGRGIRSLEKSASGGDYLLLAGPAGAATAEVTHDFRLYRWDGLAGSAPVELDVNLDILRDGTGGSFESIVDVRSTGSGTLVQLLQDNGDTVWPGQSAVSKDLAPSLQKFQGNWIALGTAVVDNAGPTLASVTPADDSTGASVSANLVLRFNEGVKAGTGSFVIRHSSDNSLVEAIAANDTTKVTIGFNTVTLHPASDLAHSTGYYVEATSDVLTDPAGNAWAGLAGATAWNFTTASAAPVYKLLITEVNSNATGGDFFELYNHGTTAIDLTGWKWDDDSANPADAAAVSLSGILLPGARLVVVAGTDAAAFRAAWGLPATVAVLATGGPGLGNGDAVVVFDQNGYVAAGVNFKSTSVTAADGSVIAPMVRSDGLALAGAHAGLAAGGTASESAVWDGVSTSAPQYNDAEPGVLGAFAQSSAPANVGSPGNIKAGASLAVPYTENFATSLGEFTAYSVDTGTATTWARASSGTAEVNGFGDAAPANDWLISKAFDLSQTSVEYLSFTTWTNFADAGIANPEVRVKYSADYPGTGNPALYTWTELAYTPAPEASQTTTPSGLIDLSSVFGSNVHFAFQYTASGTGSNSTSLWRVDDVRLEGYTGAVLAVKATDASKMEGDTGSSPFTFTVTRAGDTSGATTVDYVVSGAAVDAADFGGTLPSGAVSFGAGETSKTVSLIVTGDLTIEPSEAFNVTLSNASAGASIAQATATGTIQTDDVLVTRISVLQGSGSASPLVGQTGVTIEGIVTAYLPNLKGFFVQEEAADQDGNASTSEGIFVYYNAANPGLTAASVGDAVRVTGTVAEFSGQTQLTAPTVVVLTDNADAGALPAPVQITLPVADMVHWEAVEGMLVEVSSATPGGQLVLTDNYNLGRYGSVTLTSDDLLLQYTETSAADVAGYTAYQAMVQRDQIILDDGSSSQNPAVHPGRGGNDLSAGNPLRAGDAVTRIVGVLDQLTSVGDLAYETSYRIQPTVEPVFTGAARPAAADLPAAVTGAEIKVASANVLNYFTSLGTTKFANPNGTLHDPRGATDAAEFIRQQDKIVANLLGLDADVIGLMEMQNNGFADGTSAIDALVDALNAVAGAGTYAYIAGPFNDGATTAGDAVTAGDDAIMVAMLYQPAKVTPLGQAAVASPTVYDAFSAAYGNRVPLAQTFQAVADGEKFTVVVNHFKSKGSVNDPDLGDGQGNNNLARMEAARDLLDWLATDPTGSGDSDVLLLGDFNAYSKEDPIAYIDANGFDKVSTGLSYSFDGLWGSLDHMLASNSLSGQVTGSVKWAINAEEPAILDYNLEFKNAAQDLAYYAADAYRSSDHNPILIGLNLNTAPVLVTAMDDRQGTEDTPFTFTLPAGTFTDTSGTLTLGATGVPAWLSFDADTATFSGTPGNKDVGFVDLTVTATDADGASTSDTFRLTVDNANDAPVGGVAISAQGRTLTAVTTALADDDGLGTLHYTWLRNGADFGAPDASRLDLSAADVGALFSVRVTYTDLRGTAEGVTSASIDPWTLTPPAGLQAVHGSSRSDFLRGTDTADLLRGMDGRDTLLGGQGEDWLDGGRGTDRLAGGAGDDTYIVDSAQDRVVEYDGEGLDTVYSDATHMLGAHLENLFLVGKASIHGLGNTLDNQLAGNDAFNLLRGGTGHDTLDGAGGNDRLYGEAGNDVLLGGTGNDLLDGGAGNDRLLGGEGHDTLVGGPGQDTLDGGAGRDLIVFDTTPGAGNVDTLQNFNALDDTIQLERYWSFASLKAKGPLAAKAFWTGAAAHDADDRIIYDSGAGHLWYDADGTGAMAAVQFATLVGLTGTLTHLDFVVV